MEQDSTKNKLARGAWSSQAGFIAASVGSAVGLGNVWRFPYVAGENGGGAFVLAYLISVALLGVPLMMFEFGAGRRHAAGVFGVFSAIAPRAKYAGAGIAVIAFLILSYYAVVAGWTLGHAGIMGLGIEPDFEVFSDSWASLALFGVSVALMGAIVLRGVQGGIEVASRTLLPFLTLALLAIAIYSLTLDGRERALEFLFEPRFEALREPRVWANAMGQAMFSLIIGSGVLVTFGGYMRPDRRTGFDGADRWCGHGDRDGCGGRDIPDRIHVRGGARCGARAGVRFHAASVRAASSGPLGGDSVLSVVVLRGAHLDDRDDGRYGKLAGGCPALDAHQGDLDVAALATRYGVAQRAQLLTGASHSVRRACAGPHGFAVRDVRPHAECARNVHRHLLGRKASSDR